MTAVGDFLTWLQETFWGGTERSAAAKGMYESTSLAKLNEFWDALPDAIRNDKGTQSIYATTRAIHTKREAEEPRGFSGYIEGLLNTWLDTIKKYETTDPKQAIKNLSQLTADVMIVAGASAAIDVGLGMLPNSSGTASATNTKEMMKWLGMGAVITAVAHDPVKIGLLRPYQDSLEQTFRNRRPDDNALFQAYRTRELSPIKVDDLSKLTDTEMNRIETDNDAEYFRQISRWGYSEAFALSLSRSATRTLGFSQLATLARAGIFDKGFCIYSLWGEGLDRVCMSQSLAALETLRDREMYSGFRSMIEPSYVDGSISEDDLIDYWKLAGVPTKVQTWVLPRMQARRAASVDKEKNVVVSEELKESVRYMLDAYIKKLISKNFLTENLTILGYNTIEIDKLIQSAELREEAKRKLEADKAKKEKVVAEKDLTVSQLQLAYQDTLIDRAKAKADIISLGYSAGETDILLNISELRRKTPSVSKLKRLTLTDYEKAYKNKIITLEQVMERMTGEYAASDIAIERKLLEMGKA